LNRKNTTKKRIRSRMRRTMKMINTKKQTFIDLFQPKAGLNNHSHIRVIVMHTHAQTHTDYRTNQTKWLRTNTLRELL